MHIYVTYAIFSPHSPHIPMQLSAYLSSAIGQGSHCGIDGVVQVSLTVPPVFQVERVL